jgi:hypothetical protein
MTLHAWFGRVIALTTGSIFNWKERVTMNLKKWAGLCMLITMVFVWTSGVGLAQDAKTFEGTLIAADANARVITLKAGDTEKQFTFSEQTEIAGTQKDGQPVAVKQGSRLKITYTENEKANIATKIEVLEL